MNTDEILKHLKDERNKVHTAILVLEGKLSTQENGAVHVAAAQAQHKNNLIDFADADLRKVKDLARVKIQYKPGVRHMSRAARMRISQAQKMRWARQKRQAA